MQSIVASKLADEFMLTNQAVLGDGRRRGLRVAVCRLLEAAIGTVPLQSG